MKHHLTFFVALLLAPPVTLHAADAPRKPNLIIILADDTY